MPKKRFQYQHYTPGTETELITVDYGRLSTVYRRGPKWEETLGDHSVDEVRVAGERTREELEWSMRDVGTAGLKGIAEYLVNVEPPLTAAEVVVFFAGAGLEPPTEAKV